MTEARPDIDVAPEVVEAMLHAVAKAFSAVQLYLPNNQQRALRMTAAREAFVELWRYVESVDLEVRENAFVLGETVVYQANERGADALPWLLYRDGIRGISFEAGFEETELDDFLARVHAARTATNEDDDLVTRLWVANNRFLSYRFLDSYGSDSGGGPEDTLRTGGLVADGPDEPAAPAFIRIEDFDSALYFLDHGELRALQGDLDRSEAEDPRRPVLDSLLDLLEVGVSDEALPVVCASLDTLVVELLTTSAYELVAYALREIAKVVALPGRSPDMAAMIGAIPDRLSEPRAMAQLLLAIDESERPPSVNLLEELFRELRPEALVALARWLGTAGASPVRAAVERASLRLAAGSLGELGRLLEHDDPEVVRGAIKIAAQLAPPAVVPGLAKLLRSEDVFVRLEAVGALANIGSPGALQALERAIDDPERDVRVAIYRTIGSRRYTAALPRLLAVLRARESRAADLGEKMALFETFGGLCGDAGVSELDAILNSRGLLGAKEPPEFRACAARALGLIGSASARTALQKASEAKEVVVRSAVARAIRGGA